MKKQLDSRTGAWLKILLSVVILALCGFRKHFLPQDNTALNVAATVITFLLILLCLRWILGAVSTLIGGKEEPVSPDKLPKQPIKCLTEEELFAYLEKEDIIDLILARQNADPLRIGTRSDYARSRGSSKGEYFDKCYYIEDAEYTDLSEFIARFHESHPDHTARILYAGIEDMAVEIQ